MSSHGIRDKVAIVGMGCTRFGELWDRSTSRPARRSVYRVHREAPRRPDDVDAFWLGTMDSGYSGLTLSTAAEDRRKAGHARREHVRDRARRPCATPCTPSPPARTTWRWPPASRSSRTPAISGLVRTTRPTTAPPAETTAPAAFSLPGAGLRRHVRPRRRHDARGAQPHRGEEPRERRQEPAGAIPHPCHAGDVARSPLVAGSLGVLRLLGRRRRRRGRLVVRAEDALQVHRHADVREGTVGRRAGDGSSILDDDVLRLVPEASRCAADAYRQAGITDPRREISLAEVHDCFTPTEFVLMEDLGFSERGHGLEGRPRRCLRPRRRAAGQHRRRAQVVRTPDRRHRACA